MMADEDVLLLRSPPTSPSPPASCLYDEYAAIAQRYKALYGDETTLVLMEVGSFLEWYDGGDGRGADVHRICALLNVQATRKNKTVAIVSRTNPAFSGVPRVAAAKYVQVLVDAGYSVVMVMQVTPPPNPKRAVTEVISKATCVASEFLLQTSPSGPLNSPPPPACELLALYIDDDSSSPAPAPAPSACPGERPEKDDESTTTTRLETVDAVGWALVDLSTGRTRVGQDISSGSTTMLVDRLRGVVLASQPAETVIVLSSSKKKNREIAGPSLCAQLALQWQTTHIRVGSAWANAVRSPAYQNEVLARAFPRTGFLTPAEYVDLERMPHALTAFVSALQFAYEHNECVIGRIQRPIIDDAQRRRELYRFVGDEHDSSDDHQLIAELGSETPMQLGVVGGGGSSGGSATADLVGMFNRCKTVAGRRAFRDRLLRPLVSSKAIEARLVAVSSLLRTTATAATATNDKGKKKEKKKKDGDDEEDDEIRRRLSTIETSLSRVGDVERCYRRLCIRRRGVTTSAIMTDFASLVSSMQAATEALSCAQSNNEGDPTTTTTTTSAIIAATRVRDAIVARINLCDATSAACATPSSCFLRGVHVEVDRLQDELDTARGRFYSAAKALNVAIGAEHVRVEGGCGGYASTVDAMPITDMMRLTVTARRWAAAVKSGAAARAVVAPWFCGGDASLDPLPNGGGGGVSAAAAGGSQRLWHPELSMEASLRVANLAAALDAEQRRRLLEFADEMAEDATYADDVALVVRAVEDVDVSVTVARNAFEHNHVRPTIINQRRTLRGEEEDAEDGEWGSSYVRAVGLRHPVIEALPNRREAYVANDVTLGVPPAPSSSDEGGGQQDGYDDDDAGCLGMLLYGVNAVGKSSTMKAVGLAVIMAQAGMYVAASSIDLCPFESIHTRIGLHDDLGRGRSTFMVEMLELRAILRCADRHALVIGDELCAGTESASALSIVGAGIATLAKRGTPFVFATHLHELVGLPHVADLISAGTVRAMHLSVRFDEGSGRLVMDRRLTPGPGRPTYGLEVCRSLDMDPEFMQIAETLRRRVLGIPTELVSPRFSRYNRRVIVDRCALCGSTATETHHIVHQACADSFTRNQRHNLAPLCGECHRGVHAGKLSVVGYKQTSDGVVLLTRQ